MENSLDVCKVMTQPSAFNQVSEGLELAGTLWCFKEVV